MGLATKILKCFGFLIILHVILIVIYSTKYYPETVLTEGVEPKQNVQDAPVKLNYYPNYNWMFNNHVIQYSSYLIVNQTAHSYWIECIVNMYYKDTADVYALVKNTDTDQIVELQPTQVLKLSGRVSYKFIFENIVDALKDFFLQSNIAIAIIHLRDFDGGLENVKFYQDDIIQFPMALINFQMPTVVRLDAERKRSVAHCVKFIFNNSFEIEDLKNWIDFQLAVGIDQMILHDGTFKQLVLKNFETYSPHVIIRPFRYRHSDICSLMYTNIQTNANTKLTQDYMLACDLVYKFNINSTIRYRYDAVSSNDCYTVYKYTYEFVSHYDIDELILPRNGLNPQSLRQKHAIKETCGKNDVCKTSEPLIMPIYDYIQKIIEKYHNFEYDQINSIIFRHTAYLIPDASEEKLISALELRYQTITDDMKFPLRLFFGRPEHGHTFTIEKEQLGFIREFLNAYQNTKCLRSRMSDVKGLTTPFKRYLYIITHKNQRYGKSVFYTKSVDSIACHSPKTSRKGTHYVRPLQVNGDYLIHFRHNISKVTGRNFATPITSLNIDFEYLNLLVKNFTNFCSEPKKTELQFLQ